MSKPVDVIARHDRFGNEHDRTTGNQSNLTLFRKSLQFITFSPSLSSLLWCNSGLHECPFDFFKLVISRFSRKFRFVASTCSNFVFKIFYLFFFVLFSVLFCFVLFLFLFLFLFLLLFLFCCIWCILVAVNNFDMNSENRDYCCALKNCEKMSWRNIIVRYVASGFIQRIIYIRNVLSWNQISLNV